jgi:hypothetical protein
MAIKSVAVSFLSGGALLLGYAAFARLRPRARAVPVPERRADLEPLSERLEHVPEEQALDVSGDPPLNEQAVLPPSAVGALFLGRAIGALSPFDVQSGPRVAAR